MSTPVDFISVEEPASSPLDFQGSTPYLTSSRLPISGQAYGDVVQTLAYPKQRDENMPPIKQEWYEITREVILEAQERIKAELTNPLLNELPGIAIQELAADFFKKMRELIAFANEIHLAMSAQPSEVPDLNSTLIPLFKALFLNARLTKARVLDQQRSKTTNPQVIAALKEKLRVYEGILREEWFQAAEPEYPLSLNDLLTLA
jgi:hypothetical protein